jgi:hypothetical protein
MAYPDNPKVASSYSVQIYGRRQYNKVSSLFKVDIDDSKFYFNQTLQIVQYIVKSDQIFPNLTKF